MKLQLLLDDITKYSFFGPVIASELSTCSLCYFFICQLALFVGPPIFTFMVFFPVVYTIEFQKRGLPHVHIIVWIKKDAPFSADQIDAYISV